MKRLLSLLLAAALCLGLTGCTSRSERKALRETMDEAYGYTTVDYQMDDGTTMEQSVLYDEQNIRIVALGITGSLDDCSLWIRVENNSDRDISVYGDCPMVNGWQMDSSYSATVKKGSMQKAAYWIYGDTLRSLGAESIGEISFACEVRDGKTYDTIASFSAELETSAYSGENMVYDTNGQTIYDDKEVKVVYQGIYDSSESDRDGYLKFYVENNRKGEILLDNEETLTFAREGSTYELDAWMYERVKPGKRLILLRVYNYSDTVEDWEEDWDYDGELASLQPLTMDLSITDTDSWDDLANLEDIVLEKIDTDTETSPEETDPTDEAFGDESAGSVPEEDEEGAFWEDLMTI